MNERSEYAIGDKYITSDGRELTVLRQGYLSIQVSGWLKNSNMPIWIGAGKMSYWIESGQIKKYE